MNNKYGYVYLTTNLVNGRVYVGKRQGEFTSKYLGSGRVLELAIKNMVRKPLELLRLSTQMTNLS